MPALDLLKKPEWNQSCSSRVKEKMEFPEFTLRNLPEVVRLDYETEEPAVGLRRGGTGTDQAQSSAGSDARIAEWARASGRCLEKSEFAEKLDGRQVDREIGDIFRETPEFGRSVALRLADFHDVQSTGDLHLIGGGGEAVVFFDAEAQQVVKLLGGAGKAGFGWVIDSDPDERMFLRPGSLTEALWRFHLAESCFPTGLDLGWLGNDGSFLLLTQPFLVGENPEMESLSTWMIRAGWERFEAPSDLEMLAKQTWQRQSILASDVRSENAILAEADGKIYPFDFVVTRML